MKRFGRSMLMTALALALLTLVAQGATAAALTPSRHEAPALTCTWSIVASANPGTSANALLAAAAISSTNAWAVGTMTNTGGSQQTLIEQWNGTAWNTVPSPNVGPGNNVLSGIAPVSAGNIWAVGSYLNGSGIAQTLIEHWNGTSWRVVASPNVGSSGNQLRGVVAVSARNIWAVGYSNYPSASTTLVEQWNGRSWSVVASPNVSGAAQSLLTGVALVTSTDIWAVGYSIDASGVNHTLIENDNGLNWNIASTPNVGTGNNSLYGAALVPNTSTLWTAGISTGGNGSYQTLVENWNGVGWSVVASPDASTNTNVLNAVTSISATDAWIVGSYADSNGVSQTLIENWDGTAWNLVSSPGTGTGDALDGVTFVPHSSDAWAVGYSHNSQQSLIEFCS